VTVVVVFQLEFYKPVVVALELGVGLELERLVARDQVCESLEVRRLDYVLRFVNFGQRNLGISWERGLKFFWGKSWDFERNLLPSCWQYQTPKRSILGGIDARLVIWLCQVINVDELRANTLSPGPRLLAVI
jgi:hypothetical protein